MLRRSWRALVATVLVLGLALLSAAILSHWPLGLAGASGSTPVCPFAVNPFFTYWAEYNSSTGVIEGIVEESGGLHPPLTVPSIQVNGSLGVAMMCWIYLHPNSQLNPLPWHIDVTTRQIVSS